MRRRLLLSALVSGAVALAAVLGWSGYRASERDDHLAAARALSTPSFREAPELHDLPAGEALAHLEAAAALGADVQGAIAETESLVFLVTGDLVSAAGALREAKRDGWAPRTRLIAAAIAAGRGHLDDAEEHVREATILGTERGAEAADYRRALLFAGDLALDRAELRAARDAFGELARLEPGVSAVHNRLSLAFEGLEDWDAARAAVERALELDPELVDGWVNRGRQARAVGDHPAGAEAFGRATELAPARADAWLGRGLAALDLGDLRSARVAIERSRELAPENLDAGLAEGDLLRAEGELAEAADTYRSVLRDNLHHAAGWVKLGNVLYADGERGDAVFAYQRALERDPGLAAAYNGLGAALMGADDAAARTALRQAAELDRADPNPLMNLALLAERSGDTAGARVAWSRALERAPGSPVASARLEALR